jgi:membrane protein DedA with SNARE-associated domain
MDWLFVYLTSLTTSIAYLTIFGVLLACGLGFPLPEDIPLVAAGFLVWDGTIHIAPAIVVTLVGVLIGDTLLFYLGRKLGLKIVDPRAGGGTLFKPARVRRTRAYFRKYGSKIVFFARFVAGIRAVAFFMAGATGMKYSRFLFLDALAAFLSVPVWILTGYGLGHFFGDRISVVLQKTNNFKYVINSIVLIIVVVFVVRFIQQYKKAKAQKLIRRAALIQTELPKESACSASCDPLGG